MLATKDKRRCLSMLIGVPVLLAILLFVGSTAARAKASIAAAEPVSIQHAASLDGAIQPSDVAVQLVAASNYRRYVQVQTVTPTPGPTCGTGANYQVTTTTGSIIPAPNLVPDSQCDQCAPLPIITLPFTYYLYGQPFNSVTVGDNGTLAFTANANGYSNLCLPRSNFSNAIMAHWDNLDTRTSVRADLGIFTLVEGSAPNRIFNIEWRACRYGNGVCGGFVNFEVRLYEGQNRFDIIYGEVSNNGTSATIGVQRDTGSQFTQATCNTADSVQPGQQYTFFQPECATNTPTVTPTFTPTNTRTLTPTSTNTWTPTNTATGTLPTATPTPPVGGANVCVSCPETTSYPKVTQSESFVWGNGNTIIITHNDSRASSGCYGGGAYSTDGGATFNRIGGAGASPFCTGHGTNFGDPTVVYSVPLNKWFASFLATGCGGQGIGVWESADGITWTTGACAHNGSSDDRQSHWIDNNPASPYYGRQYISWNNFALSQQIQVVYSDNGTTWSAPVNVTTTFIRNVQITGDLAGSGAVYIAGMNEGGGGLNGPRQNIMYKSTNGGTTWTATTIGPTFLGPGRSASGYFATMYAAPAYWRHMGWGQPAANGNFVHLVYAERPTAGGDPGNVLYVRSTDAGTTWSAPIQLNTDTTTRLQWQPSLAANAQGSLLVGWYDERETASCGTPGSTTPCYRRWGRSSTNNGATWQADDMVGDVISPLPGQPDSAVQADYAGDYDYSSADGNNFYQTWTDGRNLISGNSQQDVFFRSIALVQGTPTPTPTGTLPTATPTRTFTLTPTITPTPCGAGAVYAVATGTATIVPGTTNTGSACDDCVTSVTLPFPFQLYDQSFTQVGLDSNGKAHFPTGASVFTNTCLPQTGATYTIYPYWDDLLTTGTCTGGCGIFTSISGTAPNRIFNIEWRTTYFTGGGNANFELRLYECAAPCLTSRFDVVYGALTQGNTSATGGVQKNGTTFTQDFCNGTGGAATGVKIYTAPVGCGTAGPTNTATRTPTGGVPPTATCAPGGGPIIVNGAITTTDPDQTGGRLFRDGIPDTCAAPGTCGAPIAGTYNYDAYTYTNSGPAACVNVNVNTACTGTNFIYVGAYIGTYNPANICQNWVADLGSSPNGAPADFSFTVPAGASYTIVVTEVTANAGCPAYTLTITGAGGGGCGTPPPGTGTPSPPPRDPDSYSHCHSRRYWNSDCLPYTHNHTHSHDHTYTCTTMRAGGSL